MNLAETNVLLAHAAAFDHRRPSEAVAQAWQAALDDLPLDEALDAVVAHYRDSTDFVMPAHIRRQVYAARKAARRAALDARPAIEPVPDAVPAVEVPAWRQAREDLARREAERAAARETEAAARAERHRAVDEAARKALEQQQANAERANPSRDPAALGDLLPEVADRAEGQS